MLEKLKYQKTNKGIIITGATEKLSGKLEIPKTIEDTKVIEIAREAFYNNKNITKLTIPNNCSIGPKAFYSNNITELKLGENCTIGVNAFNSNMLTELIIPENCSIGSKSFSHNHLTKLTIPEGCSISFNAFAYNRLKELSIPEGCSIGSGAFAYNKLKELSIHDGCSLGSDAFAYNNLTKLSIPKGCSIGSYAFYSNNLTKLTIPEGCSIASNAFNNNKNLESVKLGSKTVKTKCIDNYLMSINSIKQLKDFTIYNCNYFASNDLAYIAQKGKYYAHSESIKQAIEDVNFKFLQAEMDLDELVQNIKDKDLVTVQDYRLLTGACKFGCQKFIDDNNLKTEYSIKEAIAITKYQYGSSKLKELLM